jgi:2',3'-cyclic-nucleotide 2'-phosphodiesterase/3'-nucleotidase
MVRVLTLLLLALPALAERVTITVLGTTDLHGNIYPIDYFTNRPAARGLAKIATLIQQARAENPHNLLIDCGDTIQGTPLEYVYQTYVRTGRLPLNLSWPGQPLRKDPMMAAMNHLRYDAMVIGNHECAVPLAGGEYRGRAPIQSVPAENNCRCQGGGDWAYYARGADLGKAGKSGPLQVPGWP